MNAKERVKNVIAKKQTDYTPHSFDLTGAVQDKIAKYYGIDSSNVPEFMGDNLRYVFAGNISNHIPVGSNVMDEFGIVWDKSSKLKDVGDWGGIISSPLNMPTLDGYNFPDFKQLGWFKKLNEDELKASDKYLILATQGIFTLGWHMRGFENLLADFITEEAFVNELFDKILEFNLELIAQAPSYFDGIRFGDDWGQQKGLIMGPGLWRKYLKPRHKVMYDTARKRGFNVFIHSCGDIYDIFPDLIELGVQVVNPIQPEVMDVNMIKKNYGKDLVLYGGMGCQSVIPNGTVEEVISQANDRLSVLGKGGGYIFGPAGAIPADAKMDNVIALVEFVRNMNK